jgi:hypothetical protein
MPWFSYPNNEPPVTAPGADDTEVDDEVLGMEEPIVQDQNMESSALEIPDGFTTSNSSHDIMKDSYWVCQPYKQEIIQQQLTSNAPGANRRTALIGSLRDLGVKVFIIEAKSIDSTADILHHVKRVVGFVARENVALKYNNSDEPGSSLGFQRCLLYQDRYGRLLNLTLSQHAAGPTSKYQEFLDSFSGLEAMIALTVLSRSFPCAMEGR